MFLHMSIQLGVFNACSKQVSNAEGLSKGTAESPMTKHYNMYRDSLSTSLQLFWSFYRSSDILPYGQNLDFVMSRCGEEGTVAECHSMVLYHYVLNTYVDGNVLMYGDGAQLQCEWVI